MTTSSVAQKVSTAVRRANIISGASDAAVDVRKACNGIKRMSALAAASMSSGIGPKDAVRAAEEMSMGLLKVIGFDVHDEARVNAVLPMVLEASSQLIAEATARGLRGSMDELVTAGIDAMVAVTKSRAVVKVVEPMWPANVDAITSMRITAAAAMTTVAVEADAFDFMHKPEDGVKEAIKTVIKACADAAEKMSPPQCSSATKQLLLRSLLQSAGRLYAISWKGYAQELTDELDAMDEVSREVRLSAMGDTPLSKLLSPVNDRFARLFGAVNAAAMATFEPSSEQSTVPAQRVRAKP